MTDEIKKRFDPENILGRLTALEMICVSLIRQKLISPEARHSLAESVRGVAAEFQADRDSSNFAEGFKDGLLDFAAKLNGPDD